MKKRLGTALLAIAVVSSAFAGCTGKGKDGNTPGTTPGASQPPKEVKLSLGLPGGYGITSEKIVEGFKAKHPNVKLDIDEAPWGDFTKKIATQIAGGNAPDVWFQENAAVLGYGKKGAAEDLAPYIAKDLKKDDYIDSLFATKAGDKVWGVPHGGNPIALAYNKKLFTDAKVDFPSDKWTYQDMIDAAKKLTKDTNGDGTPDVWGFFTSGSITPGWFPWIKSAGGQALDSTLEKAVFDDEKSIKGITEWTNMINKYKVSPSRTTSSGLGGETQMFGNGLVAMVFMQYSTAESIYNKNFPNLDYDTVMIPKGFDGKRVVPNVVNSWVVFSKAKQEGKDAAWTWLKYYLGEEAQNVVAESGAGLPVKKTAMTKLESLSSKPANKKAFTQGVAEAGTTLDENPSWNEWRTVAQPIFNDILDAKIAPADGLKQIKDKVQKVLDDNK